MTTPETMNLYEQVKDKTVKAAWNEGFNAALDAIIARIREAGWLQAFQSFEDFEALRKEVSP